MQSEAVKGQKHVDLLGDEAYSLSGTNNVNGAECMHAIGHDGTYHYVRMTANEGTDDFSKSSGDYIESTTIFMGKHLYVNNEQERFMVWNGDSWVVTATSYMTDTVHGRIAQPMGGFLFGSGSDKPEGIEGFSVSWETDMDLEPEWRCLMRPLLTQAVGYVEEAELSIESKMLLVEKKELVEVHKKLVVEAEVRKGEADCIETIEKAMAALEECELAVLRAYSVTAAVVPSTYPSSWLTLLHDKVKCVDTFAAATAECNHYWNKDLKTAANDNDLMHHRWEEQWGRYYG